MIVCEEEAHSNPVSGTRPVTCYVALNIPSLASRSFHIANIAVTVRAKKVRLGRTRKIRPTLPKCGLRERLIRLCVPTTIEFKFSPFRASDIVEVSEELAEELV